ncbi:MAG: protein TonB [Gammaproteobacteria bacterium]|uniref:Protein TonB n=1 Tax=OM182 bacterium MED-G24 TaxID=1986255 RepID=A0A2A5WIH8_9GAMM|nr:protein TonB [Gammaproteobacteria bacterium]PDH36330.1 MAG: protein TonB [OM182 bacterium MED-G24]RPG25633.1 MAG: energy transducer TonB [Gammaproteobacteria bacterium TMED50]|tara:strand:+ start:17389 stop:18042 length:654 start_codon:yes stop_codon:yes gene_type:complete
MIAVRLGASAVVGVFVTLALFYLMQYLIASSGSALTDESDIRLVDFVRVKQDQEVQAKQRKPKKPPPPDEPPPDVPPQQFDVNIDTNAFSMAGLDAGAGLNTGGGIGMGDGEYLPIVQVQPQYPQRALARGLQGWVVLEFTVTETGSVSDPVVVANCAFVKTPRSDEECEDSPNSVFDRAAERAVLKFKYKPKVEDGVPAATTEVPFRLRFQMADER